MKAGDFRNMSDEELGQTVRELKRELFNLRFQWSTGQLEKTDRLATARKDVARALTILRERQVASGAGKAEGN